MLLYPFAETFSKMCSLNDTYYIVVIEDENTAQVIGTGTLLVEQKFIHDCALVSINLIT